MTGFPLSGALTRAGVGASDTQNRRIRHSGAPSWLLEHLIATGAMDHQGVSRRARIRHCRDCGLAVLAGFDADLCARTVAVDPHPLTALGEAMAHIGGRYTVALHRGARDELDARTEGRISHAPAGSGRFDVLAEHRCGDRSLEPFATTSAYQAAALPASLPQEAPF